MSTPTETQNEHPSLTFTENDIDSKLKQIVDDFFLKVESETALKVSQ